MSIVYYPHLAENQRFPVLVTDGDFGIGSTVYVPYENFVCNLIKEMGSRDNNIVHMALGLAGEVGEIVDAIKKAGVYNKPLDRDNIIEELGDLEFYMAGLRQMLNISRELTLQRNIAKLEVRYKNGYSDAAAIARADKTATGETEASGVYEKVLKEQGKCVAINLTKEQVAAVDETAGLSSREETVAGFQPGGVVTAASAPETNMTLSHTGNPGRWFCQWFDGTTACSGWFDEAELRLVSPQIVDPQQLQVRGTDSPQDLRRP